MGCGIYLLQICQYVKVHLVLMMGHVLTKSMGLNAAAHQAFREISVREVRIFLHVIYNKFTEKNPQAAQA